MAGVELATAYVNLVSSAKGLGSSVVTEMGGAGNAAGVEAGKRFGGTFKKVLAGGALVGAAAVVGKSLFSLGSEFDNVSDTIRIGTGAQGKNLEALIQTSRNVAGSVPADFDKVSTTVADLNTTLGYTGAPLEKLSKQVVEAGRLVGTDLNVQDLAATFTGFGVSAEDASGSLDQIFRVSQATGVGMDELTATLSTQGGTLKTLGFGLNDSAALLGVLTKSGVNSQVVIKSLGAGLVKLTKDGEKPATAFKRVTGEIQKFVDAGDDAAAIQLAGKVFGTRGAPQLISALKSGKVNLQDMTKAAGVTDDTILGVAKDTNDFAESMKLLGNRFKLALEPISSKVFAGFSKAAGAAADGLTPLIASVTKTGSSIVASLSGPVSTVIQNLVSTFRLLVDIVGGVFATVWKSLGPVFTNLVTAVAPLAGAFSPLGLIFKVLRPLLPQIATAIGSIVEALGGALTAVLAAVTPLISAMVNVFKQIIPIFSNLIAAVLPSIVSLFAAIGPAIATIATALAPVIRMIFNSLIPVIAGLLPFVRGIFGAIGVVINGIVTVLKGIVQFIASVFTGNWKAAFSALGNIVAGIWNIIKGAAQIAWNFIKVIVFAVVTAIQNLFRPLAGFFSGIWNSIKTTVSVVWSFIKGFVTGAYRGIVAVWSAIRGFFSGLFGGVRVVVVAVWGFIKGIITGVVTAVRSVWSGITGFFSGLFSTVKNIAFAVWSFIKGTITGVVTGVRAVWNGISSFFSGLFNGVRSVASSVWDGIKGVITAIVQPIRAVWDGIYSFFSNLFQGVRTVALFVWGGIESIVTAIVGPIRAVWDGIYSFFSNLFQGVRNVVSGAMGFILGRIADVRAALSALSSAANTNSQVIGRSFGLPGNASGGMVPRGYSMVGERGPELVYRSQGGAQVFSNPTSRRMLASAQPAQGSDTGRTSGPLIGQVNVARPIDEARLARELDRHMAFQGTI